MRTFPGELRDVVCFRTWPVWSTHSRRATGVNLEGPGVHLFSPLACVWATPGSRKVLGTHVSRALYPSLRGTSGIHVGVVVAKIESA